MATKEQIELIPLADIEFAPNFNIRHASQRQTEFKTGEAPEGYNSENDESALGLQGLTSSIDAARPDKKSQPCEGQNQAITVCRPDKSAHLKTAKKFVCVEGFGRGMAINMLANRDGIKNPVIKAVVKEINEKERIEIALVDNIDREDLSAADKVFGVGCYQALMTDKKERTTVALAAKLGISQSYASKLMTLSERVSLGKSARKGLDPSILQEWRGAAKRISAQEMMGIAELPLNQQQEAWKMLLRGGKVSAASQGDSGEAGNDASWAESAGKKLENGAVILAALVKAGAITFNSEIIDSGTEGFIGAFCKVKKGVKSETLADLGDSFDASFALEMKRLNETPEEKKARKAAEKASMKAAEAGASNGAPATAN